MSACDDTLIGHVLTRALPAEDPVLYGAVSLEPEGAFEARSLQTFTLTYITGRYGLDDTGSIRIVFRYPSDGGALQHTDPTALNYVSARSSNGVPLKITFDSNGHQRPWYHALTVSVTHGYLREGDSITLVFGDTSNGSPGLRLQSMCESAFEFRVLADVCATGHYVPVQQSPKITIAPGPPHLWKAVLPTLRRPGEPFRLGIKAEDRYGNPSDKVETRLSLQASCPVQGLPDDIVFPKGNRSVTIGPLVCDTEECLEIGVFDQQGALLIRTNPLYIRQGSQASFWGDMHGQSGESVGINTAREYFEFARDLAFLDATSHQANDFQINSPFWSHINELTSEFHEDGRFLTLPGYEWSGNTGVGGDRNVYFRTEGRTIHRSSHTLVEDRSDITTDSPTARQLFEDLREEDCFVYAHIGGRPADVRYAHDPRLETAMEIHSAWGTFEWLMEDCFREGYRVGVVANSDGHKGRPGASYPGASGFGAYGGLTCFLMDKLDRDSLFDCVRKRRHYATTGDRIFIDLSVTGTTGFDLFRTDPAYGDGQTEHTPKLQMGDIAKTQDDVATLSVSVHGHAPIERIDVLNAMETIQTIRNTPSGTKSPRVRVVWRGATVKGRGARAAWNGKATFDGCTIRKLNAVNVWNPDRELERDGENSVIWESGTAGNFGAFDAWLDEGVAATLRLETNHVSESVALEKIGLEDTVIPAGGLDLEIRLFRLAEQLDPAPMQFTRNIPLAKNRDNPIWIRVTTEDGFQAWTSPVYLIKNHH